MLTYEELRKRADLRAYIESADASLRAMGYTEHSFPHVTHVAVTAAKLLSDLGYPQREVELAKIAGFLHDIGNLVTRANHSQSGALMAFRILDELGLPPEELALVVTAIGNHDEGTGVAVNPVAAALILADKSDVRRSRVRNTDLSTFDIHDRVNYSVESSSLRLLAESKELYLDLKIDTEISPVMDYFEIFIGRMIMCRKAAEYLGLSFHLLINGQQLL